MRHAYDCAELVTRRDRIEHWQDILEQAWIGQVVAFDALAVFTLLALFLSPVFRIPMTIAFAAEMLAFGIVARAALKIRKLRKRKL